MANASASSLFHLTFYKAGSQWVRDVLADERIASHSGFQVGVGGVDLQSEPWPVLADRQIAAPLYSAGRGDWRRHARPGDLAVVVLRDPRDIVVSLVHSLGRSHVPSHITRLLRDPVEAASPAHRVRIGMFLFSHWAAAMRSWTGGAQESSEYVTSYQKLLADSQSEFQRIAGFAGWDIPLRTLADVVAYHDFQSRTGRRPGEENEFSHRRKGIAGDWMNHFDQELARAFEESFPGLLADLELEPSTSWWKDVADVLPDTPRNEDTERNRLLQVLGEYQAEAAGLQHAAAARLNDVVTLHRVLEERAEILERQSQELDLLRAAAESRLSDVNALTALVNDKSLEAEAYRGAADSTISQLQQRVHELEAELAVQSAAARDRLEPLERLNGSVSALEQAAAERLRHIHQLHALLAQAQVLADQRLTELRSLKQQLHRGYSLRSTAARLARVSSLLFPPKSGS